MISVADLVLVNALPFDTRAAERTRVVLIQIDGGSEVAPRSRVNVHIQLVLVGVIDPAERNLALVLNVLTRVVGVERGAWHRRLILHHLLLLALVHLH